MTAPSSAPVLHLLRMVRPAKEYTQMDGTIADGFSFTLETTSAETQFHHREVATASPGANLAVLHAMGAMQKVCAEFRGRV